MDKENKTVSNKPKVEKKLIHSFVFPETIEISNQTYIKTEVDYKDLTNSENKDIIILVHWKKDDCSEYSDWAPEIYESIPVFPDDFDIFQILFQTKDLGTVYVISAITEAVLYLIMNNYINGTICGREFAVYRHSNHLKLSSTLLTKDMYQNN